MLAGPRERPKCEKVQGSFSRGSGISLEVMAQVATLCIEFSVLKGPLCQPRPTAWV
jgi:hypothetical protein